MQVSNMSWLLFFVQLSLISWALLAAPQPASIATFSIVARDPETGDFGVAVQSRYFDVGSVCPAPTGVRHVAFDVAVLSDRVSFSAPLVILTQLL